MRQPLRHVIDSYHVAGLLTAFLEVALVDMYRTCLFPPVAPDANVVRRAYQVTCSRDCMISSQDGDTSQLLVGVDSGLLDEEYSRSQWIAM